MDIFILIVVLGGLFFAIYMLAKSKKQESNRMDFVRYSNFTDSYVDNFTFHEKTSKTKRTSYNNKKEKIRQKIRRDMKNELNIN